MLYFSKRLCHVLSREIILQVLSFGYESLNLLIEAIKRRMYKI